MDDPKTTVELLKRMQESLLEVKRLESQLHDIPERIAALHRDTEERQGAVTAAEEALKEEKLTRAKLEVDLKTQQEHLSNKNTQTLAVKTNEQLWAIQKEIDFIKQKASDIELKIIESMEELDTKEQKLKDAKATFAAHSADNRNAISEFEKELEDTRSMIDGARARYADIHGQIPPHYAGMLERIGASKNGVAMAEAVDGVCTACNVRMRPQVYMEIKLGKVIHQCPNCSRILFYRGEAANENQ